MNMFVIIKNSGEYELNYSEPISIVKTEEEAKYLVDKLTKEHDKICELAIHDKITFYNSETPYSDLCCDFYEHVIKKINTTNPDELSDKEYDDFEKFKGDYKGDYFRKWCKEEKGLTDDVIEATIFYNNEMEYNTITYEYKFVEFIENVYSN